MLFLPYSLYTFLFLIALPRTSHLMVNRSGDAGQPRPGFKGSTATVSLLEVTAAEKRGRGTPQQRSQSDRSVRKEPRFLLLSGCIGTRASVPGILPTAGPASSSSNLSHKAVSTGATEYFMR